MGITLLDFRGDKAVIDNAGIRKKLGETQSLDAVRGPLMLTLKELFQQGRTHIRSRFLIHENAVQAVSQHSSLMDEIIRTLNSFAAPHFKEADQLCVVAVGGYGRSEMFPASDIDLLFLCEEHTPALRNWWNGYSTASGI